MSPLALSPDGAHADELLERVDAGRLRLRPVVSGRDGFVLANSSKVSLALALSTVDTRERAEAAAVPLAPVASAVEAMSFVDAASVLLAGVEAYQVHAETGTVSLSLAPQTEVEQFSAMDAAAPAIALALSAAEAAESTPQAATVTVSLDASAVESYLTAAFEDADTVAIAPVASADAEASSEDAATVPLALVPSAAETAAAAATDAATVLLAPQALQLVTDVIAAMDPVGWMHLDEATGADTVDSGSSGLFAGTATSFGSGGLQPQGQQAPLGVQTTYSAAFPWCGSSQAGGGYRVPTDAADPGGTFVLAAPFSVATLLKVPPLDPRGSSSSPRGYAIYVMAQAEAVAGVVARGFILEALPSYQFGAFTGQLQVQLFASGSTVAQATVSTTGGTHSLAMSHDGGVVRLYLDGALVASANWTYVPILGGAASGTYVGYWLNPVSGIRFAGIGTLDELFVLDRAMTAYEAVSLHRAALTGSG